MLTFSISNFNFILEMEIEFIGFNCNYIYNPDPDPDNRTLKRCRRCRRHPPRHHPPVENEGPEQNVGLR